MLQRSKNARRRTLRLAGVSLALSAALVAAVACSPAGTSGSGAPDTAKITIGLISPGTSQAPLFVAIEEGFFSGAGLDVTTQNLSGGTPAAMAAFATGSVNVLAAGSTEFIEYMGKKVISGKIFAELADQNYDVVVDKRVTSIPQLKGKVIGISSLNGADEVYLAAVLAQNGISDKDVTFLASGGSANRLTALASGVVQAIAVSNANRDASMATGAVLLKSGESSVQFPSTVLFASSDLLSKHPGELKKFLTAVGKAIQWMRTNPAAAAAHCAKATGATNEACASAIAINLDPAVSSKFTWSSTNAINTIGLESALGVMASFVPETKNLTVKDIADTTIAGAAP
jgi:NitT/TauT family transport system substrate-binding protein